MCERDVCDVTEWNLVRRRWKLEQDDIVVSQHMVPHKSFEIFRQGEGSWVRVRVRVSGFVYDVRIVRDPPFSSEEVITRMLADIVAILGTVPRDEADPRPASRRRAGCQARRCGRGWWWWWWW